MSEFRPILANNPPERVRALLSSARLDVPPERGRHRTLAALGLGATLATTTQLSGATALAAASAAPVAGSATGVALLVTKWAAMGLVAGAVCSGTAVTVREHARIASPAAPHDVAEPAAPPRTEAPPAARFSEVPEPPPVAAERKVAVGSVSAMPPSAVPPQTGPAVAAMPDETTAPPEPGQRPSLMAEIAALDRAQRALAAGQAAAALGELDAYQRQFPSPRLGPEANVVRIQALLAVGRTAEARNLGERLLRREPDGALAQRVRSLLGMPPRP
jgi:hypothetical protein